MPYTSIITQDYIRSIFWIIICLSFQAIAWTQSLAYWTMNVTALQSVLCLVSYYSISFSAGRSMYCFRPLPASFRPQTYSNSKVATESRSRLRQWSDPRVLCGLSFLSYCFGHDSYPFRSIPPERRHWPVLSAMILTRSKSFWAYSSCLISP
jgi:hypothetical protein